MKRRPHHNGFTLLELLVVLGVIGVLVGLLLPAVQAAREAARRMSCSNNLKQVTLGVAQYHDAFDVLPPHGTGTFNNTNDPRTTNQFQLSFLVSITPFVGQQSLWQSISGEQEAYTMELGYDANSWYGGVEDESLSMSADGDSDDGDSGESEQTDETFRYPPMGPVPTETTYMPWINEVPLYRCPSDPGYGRPAMARTNYVACVGDAIEGLDEGLWRHDGTKWSPSGKDQMQATGRGMFVPRMITSFSDVTDGLSNTIMLAEVATDLGDKDTRSFPSINNGWFGGVLDDENICRQFIDPERPRFWNRVGAQLPANPAQGRGFRWADATPLMTGMNTITPPNHELCFGGDATTIGTLPASSRHQGGCHVAMGDGSVVFMTDSVEAGFQGGGSVTLEGKNERSPESPSPFGLWGALGTRGQNELISETLNQ